MKEETYNKALRKHREKVAEYADKMHDIVLDMLDDGCSANDVIGLLEGVKMYMFDRTVHSASMRLLEEIAESLSGEEE